MALQRIPFSRGLVLLFCTTLIIAVQEFYCHAFSSSLLARSSSTTSDNAVRLTGLLGRATSEDEDRSRPNIQVIRTSDDYVKFLEEDDRLCVIK